VRLIAGRPGRAPAYVGLLLPILLPIALPGLSPAAVGAPPADVVDCRESRGGATAAAPSVDAVAGALHLDHAHAWVRRHGRLPGEGVRVAVVDSGVATDVVPVGDEVRLVPGGGGRPSSPHGTTVAGIVAAAAPAAELASVRVFEEVRDAPGAANGARTPTTGAIAQGLRRVGDDAASGDRTVAVVATAVPPSAALRSALDDLERRGVLVVAAGGDRPTSADDPVLGRLVTPAPGQDAADAVWPAAHATVLAVGAAGSPGESEEAVRAAVVPSSAIDVAAPTTGGASYGLGGRCVLTEPSSEWAAAYVAGVAATVWSAHPHLDPAGVRARLQASADGNGTPDSPYVGYGVVQPLEALHRSGETAVQQRDAERRAPSPVDRAGRLAETRDELLWWALAAGGVLLIAVIVLALSRHAPRQRS
jgi:membrane-anchored mycosin MYCP